MDFKSRYEKELNDLLLNEDNFEFFRNLAMEHMRYNPKFFKEVFDQLLIFTNTHKLDKTKGWVYYFLGWYYTDIAEYEKAVDIFLSANEIFDTIGDKKGLIYACNGLTNVYTQIGQFKLANEWGLNGISLAEETNDREALVLLIINTGINYIQMKYFHKAVEIFNTIEIMNIQLTIDQQVIYKHSLAEIEINIGSPDKAIDYVEESAKLLEDKINGDTCNIYKLKGMAYAKLEEYDIAEKEFVKAYDVAIKLECIYEKCCVMVEWSKLCTQVGRNCQAIDILKQVVATSKDRKFYTLLRESNQLLYLIYKKLNIAKDALLYLENYILIDDKIYDYEQNQIMAKMNIKHTEREADLYKLLYDKTELLSSIGQKIISNLDIDSITDIINNEINKLIKADVFGIAIYDSENEEITYNFVKGNSKLEKVVTIENNDNSTFSYYCIKNKTDIIINNVSEEYSKNAHFNWKAINSDDEYEKSLIYTPLIIKNKVIGAMTVQSYMVNAYDKNDLNTLKIIANYSAIAIDNAISYKKVEEIATYDVMTGFLTRFEIIRLGEIIYEKHKNSNIVFSVIMIDIDNFKIINDTYGHVYGDKAINMVTDTISKCIRATDYIGRYGGDEFLLICPGAEQKEAYEVAERIRNTICSMNYLIGDNISIKITISLGVYEFGKNDLSFIDGVKKADKNLYKAKRGSKNKAVSN